MSDFFGNLGSYKMPDVQMNKGPLPTIAGGPAGSNGVADGRYNFNADLLSGITPYAYGESARMGSDKNYQQIPHRLQKIIPMLYLPAPKALAPPGTEKITVSHSVDMGDVAFAISTLPDYINNLLTPRNTVAISQNNRDSMFSFTPYCNFVTVNYILAGLQRYGMKENGTTEQPWHELYKAFGYNAGSRFKIYTKDGNGKLDYAKALPEVLRILKHHLLPFGICAGSENQGGKHEKSLLPVQAAVNHVTTMTIDGQNRDLVNYWRLSNINSGDILTFQPRLMSTQYYTLNHYYKAQSVVGFPESFECWQLEPCVLKPCEQWFQQVLQAGPGHKAPTIPHELRAHNSYERGNYISPLGYWRIGQMMHFRGNHMVPNLKINNAMEYLTGGLLQVTFAPVWMQDMSYAEMVAFVDNKSRDFEDPSAAAKNRDHTVLNGIAMQRFDNVMMSSVPQVPKAYTSLNHMNSGWLARPAQNNTLTPAVPGPVSMAAATQDSANPLQEMLEEASKSNTETPSTESLSLNDMKRAAANKLSSVVRKVDKIEKKGVKRKVSTVPE